MSHSSEAFWNIENWKKEGKKKFWEYDFFLFFSYVRHQKEYEPPTPLKRLEVLKNTRIWGVSGDAVKSTRIYIFILLYDKKRGELYSTRNPHI